MTVLVSGAGPTGLALACGLLRRGVDVRVVDAASGPASTSRALIVQPRGAEVLERLGALGNLPERGIAATTITFHEQMRDLVVVRAGEIPVRGSDRSILMVSQAQVEEQLRQRFRELGGTVEWGRELTGIDASADGVRVTVAGSGAGRVDWVVGCDGAHSAVRKLGGFGFPGKAVVERFALADVHVDLPLGRDGTHVWAHPDGFLFAFPLPGADLWRLMAPAPSEHVDTLDLLRGRVADLLERKVEFTGTEWVSIFRIQRRMADRYRAGRILLAGDAAHINSPFGGQGMNTGLGDAENLAWKLVMVVEGIAGEQLLDTYEAERRPVASEVGTGTTLLTRGALGADILTRTLRDRVALPILRRPAVQRRILEVGSQLGVSYRGGPLGSGARWAGTRSSVGAEIDSVRPGDRVPDMKCQLLQGDTVALYRALDGHWALLAPEGSPLPSPASLGPEVVRLVADVREPLLVRPDAHLAWRSSTADPDPDSTLKRFSVAAPR
ncbi:MAG: FAD-dependent monooxygenase [Nocardia sp.]|nr:FAD-dependent monooxygenase [Nocardia sp.]